ncbi:hypothetical protein DAPPUDRAFT_322354 [Daphnia pulex]|uniref:Uncharacterized protein n=1 Tax=Daphnia pulex TaxID=6669 RepID=E9GVN8_DAPPU|nr:hypothetical protein DAPPUDRAFT_322354 [Daphnia pulex]|eukprot:EFX76497.1 hypothetical protein DAPPUDRAFT_322354 [Daphnia pulex]
MGPNVNLSQVESQRLFPLSQEATSIGSWIPGMQMTLGLQNSQGGLPPASNATQPM